MTYIYKNYGTLPNQPLGEVFRINSDSALEADKQFLIHFGLKSFSQRECLGVGMYSPEWPVCGGRHDEASTEVVEKDFTGQTQI